MGSALEEGGGGSWARFGCLSAVAWVFEGFPVLAIFLYYVFKVSSAS
jgi:hypothetical protein